ncbi:MAG: hypothetical protein U5O69_03210 [Candidatus Competibacteraceae bacterium]|nr:hypothetical protein [Candidatus Competibacteraceae bacterium]
MGNPQPIEQLDPQPEDGRVKSIFAEVVERISKNGRQGEPKDPNAVVRNHKWVETALGRMSKTLTTNRQQIGRTPSPARGQDSQTVKGLGSL